MSNVEQVVYTELQIGDAFVRTNNGIATVVFVESICPDPEDPKNRTLMVGKIFGTRDKCQTRYKNTAKVVRVSKATPSVLGLPHEQNNTCNN